jgi:hypothetical protein
MAADIVIVECGIPLFPPFSSFPPQLCFAPSRLPAIELFLCSMMNGYCTYGYVQFLYFLFIISSHVELPRLCPSIYHNFRMIGVLSLYQIVDNLTPRSPPLQ